MGRKRRNLSENERLVLALLESGEQGEENILRFLRWRDEVRTANALLDGVLDGEFRLSWPEGASEPIFAKV